MSALYNLEPQPTAKVLLETTSGDVLLELFAKQTPLASRNFLQLCLDGYYTNTIFHRLVPGFVVQGGDPTGTGEGGDAIFDGGVFDDEFHSRLKFNRRGLLGMANTGRKNDNGSQFFLTLGATPELEGRNTMFGRVVGDTIYNLMKMGEAEPVEEGSERPLYPTKITGTEILVNPFDDMIKNIRVVRGDTLNVKKDVKKSTRKKPGKTLLSFGEEGEEANSVPLPKKDKYKTKLVVSNGNGNGALEKPVKEKEDMEHKADKNGSFSNENARKTMKKEIRRKVSRSPSPPSHPTNQQKDPKSLLPLPNEEEPSRSISSSPEPAPVDRMSSLLDRTNAQIAELKASMKRNIPLAPERQVHRKSTLEQMIPETATRGRKRKHGAKIGSSKDEDSLDILRAFRQKLENAPKEIERSSDQAAEAQEMQPETNTIRGNNENEEEEASLCDLHFIANCQSCQSWDKQIAGDADALDENDGSWMSHALNFDKDRLGKDLTWKKKNEEELVVIDPREKAKDIKEEQRTKRMKNTGGSRAWDRDRDRGRLAERRAGEKT
ncbi:MAG: hypothetical protein Q9190_006763 [Brigantiaea leucoxantha]